MALFYVKKECGAAKGIMVQYIHKRSAGEGAPAGVGVFSFSKIIRHKGHGLCVAWVPMRQGSSVRGGGRDIVKRRHVMKQRLLSICMALALALCLTLLPTAAWAAEGGAGTVRTIDRPNVERRYGRVRRRHARAV